MTVISLKEYAKLNNVTYEAVRQQVNRYAGDLGEHIIKDGRQQFLDEDAVAFLDSKRQKNPVVIVQQDKDEQIRDLENEIKRLLAERTEQANRIAELAQWKADNAVAIAEANHRQQLLEEKTATIATLQAQNDDLSAEKEFYLRTAADAEKDKNDALQKLTTAHESFEAELKKRDEQIQELENRKWWQLLFGGKKKTKDVENKE